VAIALALCSALSYGVADFLAGMASRRWDSRIITLGTQGIGLLTAAVAVAVDPGDGPAARALGWGAASGLCSAVGILSLYRGFGRGSISVVAPVCGVLTAVIPAVVGVALGDHLGPLELAGIILTVPAVGLVAREDDADSGSSGGFVDGALAGTAFGLLFVALSETGASHGAWPLLTGQAVSLLVIVPVAARARGAGEAGGAVRTGSVTRADTAGRAGSVTGADTAGRTGSITGADTAGRAGSVTPAGRTDGAVRRAVPAGDVALWTVIAGVLSGVANLLYLLATHRGELAIVGVVSSLYPAATVLMARVWLAERWNRVQIVGMVAAMVAVVLVAA
jgi:drug/metabolite transporter (DMT)-like permease